MKVILGVLVLAGLVVGAFYLGYNTETSEHDKQYAREMMNDKGGVSGGQSIGAYGNN